MLEIIFLFVAFAGSILASISDLKTTEIYAQTNTETKRKAIENVYPDIIDSNLPDWNKEYQLLSWLSNFK